MVGGDAGPGGQFVAAEAQGQHPVVPQNPAHGPEHPAEQQEAVGAVVVVAVVGQPRRELAEQRGGAGVHVHAVEARCRRRPGRCGEPVRQLVDLRLLHDHGHLAVDGVGHPRGGPQGVLGVGRRALAPGVAQPGQHQGAVGPAGVGHGGPARAAVGGQGGPLVGPVGGVDRSRLADHDPRPAGGPAGVVRHVAVGDVPSPAQVGHVGAEDHPGRGAPAGQGHTAGQVGHGLSRRSGAGPSRPAGARRRTARAGSG